MEKILLISTGGTIEKSYDESSGTLANRATIIQDKILSRLRYPRTKVEILSIMAKDSLDFTDDDRQRVCDELKMQSRKGHPIVVLHGTDTMDKTVHYCMSDYTTPAVPIVFTGAMKPLGFDDSDAFQNVVEALASAKILKKGYYLSFHNQIFVGDNFVKNRRTMTFDPLN